MGPGSGKLSRQLLADPPEIAGQVLKQMVYLGGINHRSRSALPEIKHRIACAWKNWVIHRRFLCSRAPLKARICIFRSLIYSALISGLEAKAPTERQYDLLNAFLADRLRALLRGAAHWEVSDGNGNIKHVALSNLQILKKVRIAPVQIELLTRRVSWYMTLSAKPEDAQEVITAMFGTSPKFGEEPKHSEPAEYRLTGNECEFALRVVRDFAVTASIEEFCHFRGCLGRLVVNPL